jgi:hypothetical protein
MKSVHTYFNDDGTISITFTMSEETVKEIANVVVALAPNVISNIKKSVKVSKKKVKK